MDWRDVLQQKILDFKKRVSLRKKSRSSTALDLNAAQEIEAICDESVPGILSQRQELRPAAKDKLLNSFKSSVVDKLGDACGHDFVSYVSREFEIAFSLCLQVSSCTCMW